MRILIVEDSPLDRRLIADQLRAAFPEAELGEAADCAEAERQVGEAELLVLDVGLPDAEPLEVVERLVSDRRPVVVWTAGLPDDGLAEELGRRGALALVHKGSGRAQLEHSVKLAIGVFRRLEERRKRIGHLLEALEEVRALLAGCKCS